MGWDSIFKSLGKIPVPALEGTTIPEICWTFKINSMAIILKGIVEVINIIFLILFSLVWVIRREI